MSNPEFRTIVHCLHKNTSNLGSLLAVPPEGEDIVTGGKIRGHLQLVHQGPLEKTNPRMNIRPLSEEPRRRCRELETSGTRCVGIPEASTKSRTVGNWVFGPLGTLRHRPLPCSVSFEAHFR